MWRVSRLSDHWSTNQLMDKLLRGVAVLFLVYVYLINEYMLNLLTIATHVYNVRFIPNMHIRHPLNLL